MNKNDSILIHKAANGFIVIGRYRYEPQVDHTADSMVFESLENLFGWLRQHFDDEIQRKRDEKYLKQVVLDTITEESFR